MGICPDLGDFTEGLLFEKEERDSIQEEYSIPVGKKEVYTNQSQKADSDYNLSWNLPARPDYPLPLRISRAIGKGGAS